MTAVTSSVGPRCFLHVPKSAGSSFHAVLHARYGEAGISPRRCDTTGFAKFDDFDALPATTRASVAVGDDELAALGGFEIVSGHFALPHLLAHTTPDRIATILREPRCRLVSLYAYYRLSPWLLEHWRPYDIMLNGRRPLHEFLGDSSLAIETDNAACRLLLHGDPRIPLDGFIAAEDVGGLAASLVDRLREFGLVGILELGQPTWEAFGGFFETGTEAVRVNVTAEQPTGVAELPPLGRITPETLRLLEERNAVDSLVYRQVLADQGLAEEDVRRLADAALADQMVRLGDIGGSRAVAAAQLAASDQQRKTELESLRTRLRDAEADLARHRTWLSEVQSSTSWQLTSPLRSAKRTVRSRRPR